MAKSEREFLRPRSSNLVNSDDWPIFVLKKAEVVSQRNEEFSSLLSADKDYLLTVRGHLEDVEPEQRHLILKTTSQKPHIEIKDISTYAFAEFQSGGYGLWAAGQAGWFLLEEPSARYRIHFEDMEIAISMLYFLADKLKKSRKSRFTHAQLIASTMRLFQDYLSGAVDHARFADVDDVERGFKDHRFFLITSMLENQEGLDWSGCPMLKWFQSKFPDDVSSIRARLLRVHRAPLDTLARDQAAKLEVSTGEGDDVSRKKRPFGEMADTPLPMGTSASPGGDQSTNTQLDDGHLTRRVRNRKSILQPPQGAYSSKTKKRNVEAVSSDTTAVEDETEAELEEIEHDSLEALVSPAREIKGREAQNQSSSIRKDVALHLDSISAENLPRKYLELSLLEYEVPSLRPQGPGDMWTCPIPNCQTRVRGASTAPHRALIREHLQSHEDRAREQIELAVDECRPYLPVNNLLRRLQVVAPGTTDQVRKAVGDQFVAPFRSKY